MYDFVIYAGEQVVGMVAHINGDRAVAKAEDVMGRNDLTWNAWKNATPAERKQAERLGSIT